MKNILVALGNAKHADALIAQAVKLAKLTDGKIWILHVTVANPDDFLALETGPQHLYDERVESRKKKTALIKQLAEEIEKNHHLQAEGILLEGSVSKAIKKKVEEHQIELVIVGHQKKDFLYGLFTANKKKDLVDELQIPLLAVPIKA